MPTPPITPPDIGASQTGSKMSLTSLDMRLPGRIVVRSDRLLASLTAVTQERMAGSSQQPKAGTGDLRQCGQDSTNELSAHQALAG